MRYTRQTERDSSVSIRVLTICSWSSYSPCSTNTTYEMHAALATTPDIGADLWVTNKRTTFYLYCYITFKH